MSRARNILAVIETMDPESEDKYDLNMARGYTYQDRGQKDDQGDTKKKSGKKPSGTRATLSSMKGAGGSSNVNRTGGKPVAN